MKKILNILLVISFLVACQEAPKKKNHDCGKGINASNIDSLPLSKSFTDYSEFLELDTYDLSAELKGNVEEIKVSYYKISELYDEVNLILTSEDIDLYNVKNQLTKTSHKTFPDGDEYISEENIYTTDNKIISSGSFKEDVRNMYSYSYSKNGSLISKKTKWDFGTHDLGDRDLSKIDWRNEASYYYNKKNQLIKEVSYSSQDSCVVKYQYDEGSSGNFYQIIKYSRLGSREYITNLNYDNIKNTLTAVTWNVGFLSEFEGQGDKSLQSEIVVYFDDNCKVSKVTKVEMYIKGMKRYSIIEFNEHGDLTYSYKFVYPKSSENDYNLTYLKEFDDQYKLEGESEYYEYVYDKQGNWIERKNNDILIKRKIKYRK